MAGRIYRVGGGASPTTAAEAVVATGAVIKTLVQVGIPANTLIKVLGWGVSFDASASATPGKVELLMTDVAATVTSLTPTLWGNPNDLASICAGGTSLTGYNASAEGSITATRVFDAQLVNPTTGYSVFFPLGMQPMVGVSSARYLRIRTTFGTTVNAYPWILYEE